MEKQNQFCENYEKIMNEVFFGPKSLDQLTREMGIPIKIKEITDPNLNDADKDRLNKQDLPKPDYRNILK